MPEQTTISRSWRRAVFDLASPVVILGAMLLGWILGNVLSDIGPPRRSDTREVAFVIAGVAVVTAIVSALLSRFSSPRRRWWTEHLLQSAILYPVLASSLWRATPFNGGKESGILQTVALVAGTALLTNGLVLLKLKWRGSMPRPAPVPESP